MSKLTPSQEDYLETIYLEAEKNGCAKVTDIAKLLDVKKASVTGALSNLCEKGLINYAPYAPITLTAEGEKEAKKIPFFFLSLSPQKQEAEKTYVTRV